jgi:hypothetical protein
MAMDWMRKMAEEKINEAIKEGAFDNLPGAGKPLELDDVSRVPEELRASYRLLKNAGVLPEEMQLRKEMVTLESLLACCTDEGERKSLTEKLSAARLRYRMLMENRGWGMSGAFAEYESKIRERLTLGGGRNDGGEGGRPGEGGPSGSS